MDRFYYAMLNSCNGEIVQAANSWGQKRMAHLKLALSFKLKAEGHLEDNLSKMQEADALVQEYYTTAYGDK